jgi:hypothetical protein
MNRSEINDDIRIEASDYLGELFRRDVNFNEINAVIDMRFFTKREVVSD